MEKNGVVSRYTFSLEEDFKGNTESLQIVLQKEEKIISKDHFRTRLGECLIPIEIEHPITGEKVKISIIHVEDKVLTERDIEYQKGKQPNQYMILKYEILNDLDYEMTISDCSYGDPSDGPMSVYSRYDKDRTKIAQSAMYYEKPEEIEWYVSFHKQSEKELSLHL